MNIPSALLYTKSHEWVEKLSDTTAKIGLSDFAQDQLGDLVFVNLPEVGDEVNSGETFADVESVKAVSDVYSPVTATVESINDVLLDAPEEVNKDPYEAWFIEVKDITAFGELMNAEEYAAYCESL